MRILFVREKRLNVNYVVPVCTGAADKDREAALQICQNFIPGGNFEVSGESVEFLSTYPVKEPVAIVTLNDYSSLQNACFSNTFLIGLTKPK